MVEITACDSKSRSLATDRNCAEDDGDGGAGPETLPSATAGSSVLCAGVGVGIGVGAPGGGVARAVA